MDSEKITTGPQVEMVSPAKSESDLVDFDWTEAEETKIRHKIDWHCVPLVTLLYMLCFLDRINIGNARIAGLANSIDVSGFRFNWALSIFYIVYLLVEVPSNMLLKKIGPRYFLPLLVVGFGAVSLFTAFVKDYAGLMTARAFLGIFEGGAMPGFAFFLSCWYKRNELLFRIGIYVSAASIAGAFGGLLAAGLDKIPPWGASGMIIERWRNIFFFEGLLTVLIGLAAPRWMPTDPETAWFLTERERRIAAARLVREQKENPAEQVTKAHLKSAMTCLHTYTCAACFFIINITVQGLSVFMPLILNNLGWFDTQAQLMTVPPYVCACVIAIAIAYISDKTKKRGLYLAIFALITVVGFSVVRFATSPNIKYMGIFFVTMGAFPGGPGFLSWAMNNTGGPAVRAVTSGWVVSLGTMGGIVATWTYISTDAPLYPTGHTINLVGQILVFLLACFGMFYCMWENKQRDAGKRDHRLDGFTDDDEAWHTLGFRHPRFRYMI